MEPSLRDPINALQGGLRHPITEFRDNSGVKRPAVEKTVEAAYQDSVPGKHSSMGERIVYWRLKKGWSRNKLAEKTGIPPSTIAGIENDDQKGSTETSKIAVQLEVNPEYLQTGLGDPKALVVVAEPELVWPFKFKPSRVTDLGPNERKLFEIEVGKALRRIERNSRRQPAAKRA